LKCSKWLLLCVVLVVASCRQSETGNTPVARLDNHTLSLEEIRARIDTAREPSQAQVQQYIQRWLTDEMLYREAIERGLDRSSEMNKKVDDVRRQLSINALLEQEVYTSPIPRPTSQELQSYYEAHKREFNLLSDAVLIHFALFPNRDAATEFRNAILKGMSWNVALKEKGMSLVAHVDSAYYTQASLLPAELWRVASSATTHEPSFPISTTHGYYVLTVWKFMKQGQTADLPYVEKEIQSRIIIEKRQQAFEQFVQTLRSKHAVEVFVNTTNNSANSRTGE
jgi:hypothetical protein